MHLRRTIERIGLLQIDSVNVLVPAHYQPLFSRLGVYDRRLLDSLAYERRDLVEQWAHEASLLPAARWPLFVHRMNADDRRLRALARFMEEQASYAARVLEEVRARGPLTAAELAEPDGTRGKSGQWWGWTNAKAALEGHFAFGTLCVRERRAAGFARVYDLTERVLPSEHRGREIPDHEAQRELLRLAAASLGVATERDLADYYRMSRAAVRHRLPELLEEGVVEAVRVEGWRDAAYLHREARVPRRIEAAALLSPFDPVVWFRPRAERLFDFDYRLEIYTPAAKRRYGYYVLPFLLGDRLVARVDLKADRDAGVLRVHGAHRESHADAGETARALAAELRTMARWLELEDVVVGRRGDLARQLAAATRL